MVRLLKARLHPQGLVLRFLKTTKHFILNYFYKDETETSKFYDEKKFCGSSIYIYHIEKIVTKYKIDASESLFE